MQTRLRWFRGRPVLVDEGLEMVRQPAGHHNHFNPAASYLDLQIILHIFTEPVNKARWPPSQTTINMYFAGKTVPLLCSVRPALTIFILMADLGFLRTTEYTGYSCPSNKTLLLSHSRGKKENVHDTKRSLQPSETMRRFNVISRAFTCNVRMVKPNYVNLH